jgi:hypothetical protein
MEKLSRTKRFEDLREQVTQDITTNEPVAVNEPVHSKPVEPVTNVKETSSADGDFLAQLLREAKEYGINTGVRQEEDTAANALSQLQKPMVFPEDNKVRTADDVEFEQQVINEVKDLYNNNNQDIAIKIKALLEGDSDEVDAVEPVQPAVGGDLLDFDIPVWDDVIESAPAVSMTMADDDDLLFEVPDILTEASEVVNQPAVTLTNEEEFVVVQPVVDKVVPEQPIVSPVAEEVVSASQTEVFNDNPFAKVVNNNHDDRSISEDIFTDTSAIDKMILQALLDLGANDDETALGDGRVDLPEPPEITQPVVEPHVSLVNDQLLNQTQEFDLAELFGDTPATNSGIAVDEFKLADLKGMEPKVTPVVEEPRVVSDHFENVVFKDVVYQQPVAEPVVASTPLPKTDNNVNQVPVTTEAMYNNSLLNPEFEATISQRVMEETKQLRLQLSDYEEDMYKVANKVSLTNKVLNAILVFLILGLVVIIAIVVYWILIAQGIV